MRRSISGVTHKPRPYMAWTSTLRIYRQRLRESPLATRLAKGAFWSLIGSIASRGLNLMSGVAVARILGKHDYGEFGMIQSTVGMLGVFAGFGMGLTATKHVAELRAVDPSRAGRVLALSTLVAWVTGCLMCLLMVIIAPWLASNTFATPSMSPLLRMAAPLLLFGGVNGAQTGALSGFEAFKRIAHVNIWA